MRTCDYRQITPIDIFHTKQTFYRHFQSVFSDWCTILFIVNLRENLQLQQEIDKAQCKIKTHSETYNLICTHNCVELVLPVYSLRTVSLTPCWTNDPLARWQQSVSVWTHVQPSSTACPSRKQVSEVCISELCTNAWESTTKQCCSPFSSLVEMYWLRLSMQHTVTLYDYCVHVLYSACVECVIIIENLQNFKILIYF